MKNSLIFILILAIVLFAQPNKNPIPIAVTEFKPAGISESAAEILTERLRTELSKTEAFKLVSRENMKEILKEQQFQQTGACDESCIIEMGQLLGVKMMVSGTVGKIGNTHTITAKLYDVKTGEIRASTTEDLKAEVDVFMKKSIFSVANKFSEKMGYSFYKDRIDRDHIFREYGYYNKKGKFVKNGKAVVIPEKNGKYTGVHYYKNGKLDGEYKGFYRQTGQMSTQRFYLDGKLEGPSISWHENGRKSRECTYRNGKAEGLSISWYENGNKSSECSYHNGKREGKSISWTEDGVKWLECYYKNDLKNGWGYTFSFSSGDSFTKKLYVNGVKKKAYWKKEFVKIRNNNTKVFLSGDGNNDKHITVKKGKCFEYLGRNEEWYTILLPNESKGFMSTKDGAIVKRWRIIKTEK